MARTKISEFSATAGSNTDIDSINLAEGCAPSGINDAIRELMSQLKDFQTGAVGDSFNGPVGSTTAGTGAFTTLAASSTTTLSGLTASTALALDASKNVVSVTNTGTGSNVLATSPTFVTPVLGTPSSGTVTNLTGTASININGTVGATTPAAGSFTTGSFTKAAAGDVLTWGAGSSKTGYFYSDANALIIGGAANAAASIGTVRFDSTGLILYGPDQSKSATVTNSGLAVTGTLSATGTTAAINGVFNGYSSVGGIRPASGSIQLGNTAAVSGRLQYDDSGQTCLYLDNTYDGAAALIKVRLRTAGTPIDVVSFSSTGLAVTGTLSATGLLDLSAATAGQIKFPATQNASADANTLDDYDQYTAASAACTGAITTAVVWKLTKVGNVVTLVLPATLGAGSAASTIDYGVYLPAKYRTGVTMNWNLPLVKNNDAFVAQPGLLQVGADGLILIYRDATAANFTANAGATSTGIASCSVSWTI